MINRDSYLKKIIEKKENGLIKVITGIRRCGKSYLLFNIYYNYLLSIEVKKDQIITLALDEISNMKYRNPLELDSYIKGKLIDNNKVYYIFIDEIQKSETIKNPFIDGVDSKITFVDVLLGLMKIPNVDLYVTGSNSKMLSSEIITEFKDRGDEIRVHPLSFKEFYDSFEGDKNNAWKEYFTYGGMPLVVSKKSHEEKSTYLKSLFSKTYITDVIERNSLNKDKDVLEELLNIISSSIGSLTNPTKLSNTFNSIKKYSISASTINNYLEKFIDAFILHKVYRYDVKGKKYIDTPLKYYFEDVGLRNARLNFRQQEENHIMENIIYNELIIRGFDVDVGVVEYNFKDEFGKSKRIQYEIDFVANSGSRRVYIQSALNISSTEKREQESKSLNKVDDSFKKIIVIKDDIIPWYDEKGILYVGIKQFLLDESIIGY